MLAVTPQQRAPADGLRGDVLYAQGRAEEAFAAYHDCNVQLISAYRDRFGAGQSALAYARDATRSQYWMLAVMVAFTSLGLWLLSAAAQ